MLAQTRCAALLGVEGIPVRVEVDVAFGLPSLTIVGLAGSKVQEARERVRSALRNVGFEVPARRITVNLAPADVPKDGTGYDLAIAVGMLLASGQLRSEAGLDGSALIGELALDGSLRPVSGVMALVAASRDAGATSVIVADADRTEAAVVPGIRVFGAATLGDAVAHLGNVRRLSQARPAPLPGPEVVAGVDLAEVRGQALARRALEIAVAGRHNLALTGPPGIGKTLLARCAESLQPLLSEAEALEVGRIRSAAGQLDRTQPLSRTRPFRSPHHTVSVQALVGGGPRVRPGEASLAHRGILFLDEALQFRQDALEALRQPMEAGSVTIARVDGAVRLPAAFALIAAFNPCPCGWRGSRQQTCRCDDASARRYAGRLSGPLRDRIDLWVEMSDVGDTWSTGDGDEPSAPVRARIERAAHLRTARGIAADRTNPSPRDADELDRGVGVLLQRRARRFRLSPRRMQRTIAVARTIADLGGADRIADEHVDEALRYRPGQMS